MFPSFKVKRALVIVFQNKFSVTACLEVKLKINLKNYIKIVNKHINA